MSTDSTAAVNPEDLEKYYNLCNEGRSIGAAAFSHYFDGVVDPVAMPKRIMFLKMLTILPEDIRQRLSPWLKSDGSWAPATFRVAARFPMDWLQHKTFSMEELEEFLRQLRAEA